MHLRSLLFIPATRPDRFDKALAAGADAVIFDLEDAVDAPRKAEAREAIAEYFSTTSAERPPGHRYLRVNSARTHWFDDDLTLWRTISGLDGVVLPKCESALEVEAAADATATAVLPLIETAKGVFAAAAIASARRGTPAVIFGAEDLTAELGVPRTIAGDEILVARSLVALAAAAAGIQAIDGIVIDVDALDDLRQDAQRARGLGFSGKLVIHPKQLPVIHEVFSPSAADIADATAIISAADAASARGEGVFRLGSRMIDAPVIARARRIVAVKTREP
jgi:citrate lyase beta subunit